MTKEVKLIINGFQKYETHEDNDLKTTAEGEYYFRNRCHYVLYEEQSEGFTQTTKSMLKLRDGCLEITRKGLVNTTMVFEQGKENVSHYRTPFGEVLLGIKTKRITISESPEQILAEVSYTLSADDKPMADCRINIQISAL